MPGILRKSAAFVLRYEKFESISLQRRVGRTFGPWVRRLGLVSAKPMMAALFWPALTGHRGKGSIAAYRHCRCRALGALGRLRARPPGELRLRNDSRPSQSVQHWDLPDHQASIASSGAATRTSTPEVQARTAAGPTRSIANMASNTGSGGSITAWGANL